MSDHIKYWQVCDTINTNVKWYNHFGKQFGSYLKICQSYNPATSLLEVYARLIKTCLCPGWCGSVNSVLACEPKSCRFDSQYVAHAWVAGGSQVRGGGGKRGNHILMLLSFYFSLTSPL